jgi:hypothetical protein
MGVGIVIGTVAMVAAGVVEVERLKRVAIPEQPSSEIHERAVAGAAVRADGGVGGGHVRV